MQPFNLVLQLFKYFLRCLLLFAKRCRKLSVCVDKVGDLQDANVYIRSNIRAAEQVKSFLYKYSHVYSLRPTWHFSGITLCRWV